MELTYNHIDLQYLCVNIGNLTGAPIRIYDGDTLAFYHSLIPLPRDPASPYVQEFQKTSAHVGYYTTEDFCFYGIITAGNYRIVTGPVRQLPWSDQELSAAAFKADVPKEELESFMNGMKVIVPMPLESVLQMLCAINYTLNGDKLTLRDVQMTDTTPQAVLPEEEEDPAEADYVPSIAPHNTLDIEETLMNIIRHGNTAALMEWMSHAPPVRAGTVAQGELRQNKNIFIVTATLASRAAIRGGLDADNALSLSDRFIQRCELLQKPEQITNLQFQMILEYTRRVERVRRGQNDSRLVLDVANYIQNHLSEPITAEAIAQSLYISRPWLCASFKKETGQTLTDFILGEKTEEAKRLLRYTDKTISQISLYLGFSSHGHFSRVFKKYAGMTPAEYREKHS